MSESERIDFENRLAQDAELKSEFEIYQSIISEVRNKAKRDTLKDKLRIADREMDMSVADREMDMSVAVTRHINRFAAYRIAASVILIVSVSTFFLYRHENKYNSIASAYWENDNGLPVTMGDAPSNFDRLMNAYKLRDYRLFHAIISSMPVGQLNSDTLLYYKAIIDHEQKNDKSATVEFQNIAVSQTSVYREKAQYRLALIYISNNQIPEAKHLLSFIASDPTSQYADRAKAILKEL
ncbi:unnamed protein product [Sphagnum balticum]